VVGHEAECGGAVGHAIVRVVGWVMGVIR